MNQSVARSAATWRVPGSSKRWVALGTIANRFSQVSSDSALAIEFEHRVHLALPQSTECGDVTHTRQARRREVGPTAPRGDGTDVSPPYLAADHQGRCGSPC